MQPNHNVRTIIIAVIVLALAAFGFYYFVIRNTTTPSENTNDPTRPERPNRPNPTFPVASSTDPNATTSPVVGTDDIPLPKLRKISQNSVAGYITFETTFLDAKKKQQKETIVRYAEKVKAPIFETKTNTLDTTRLASAEIPLIEEAVWNQKGDSLYMRYADENSEEISTYYGRLLPIKNASSSFIAEGVTFDTHEIKGAFLTKGISQLLVSATKNAIIYLTKVSDRGVAITANIDGAKKVQIFSSPLTEWTASWPKDGIVTLTNKPTFLAPSSLYFLNTATNGLEKILGGINGLVALTSPDTKSILISKAGVGSISTELYTIATAAFAKFPVTTFAEKCVWSKKDITIIFCAVPRILPTQEYPDDWYQGVVSFSDAWYRINTKNNSVTFIGDPTVLVKEEMDIVNPTITEREDYLFFQNKKDGVLWSLSLN